MYTKRFTVLLITFFSVLAFSPAWGLHGHSDQHSQVIHSHDYHDSNFEHIEDDNHKDEDSHDNRIPTSLFEYLLDHKTFSNSFQSNNNVKLCTLLKIFENRNIHFHYLRYNKTYISYNRSKFFSYHLSSSTFGRAPPFNS